MKEKALQEIVRIMREHNLTVEEVTAFAKEDQPLNTFEQFDLLYRCLWFYLRGPFVGVKKEDTVGVSPFKNGYPLDLKDAMGLFPFKDECYYLGFKEKDKIKIKFVDEECLPTVAFFQKIFPLLPEINRALDVLHKPRLQGSYYARISEEDNRICIVFLEDADMLRYEIHDGNTLAKARYLGEGIDINE